MDTTALHRRVARHGHATPFVVRRGRGRGAIRILIEWVFYSSSPAHTAIGRWTTYTLLDIHILDGIIWHHCSRAIFSRHLYILYSNKRFWIHDPSWLVTNIRYLRRRYDQIIVAHCYRRRAFFNTCISFPFNSMLMEFGRATSRTYRLVQSMITSTHSHMHLQHCNNNYNE